MNRTMVSHSRRRRLAALALALLSCGLLCASRSLYQTEALSGKVVRFHVVAEGDTAQEQARKLAVRDALLPEVQALLAGADSPAAAQARLAEELDGLAALAAAAYGAAGGTGPVTVSLGRAAYPLKERGGLALPAGVYASLRVTLGAGAGHNWWCVLFPDLSGAETASQAAEAAMAGGLSQEEVSVMEEAEADYQLRLFCADWLERLAGWLFPAEDGPLP